MPKAARKASKPKDKERAAVPQSAQKESALSTLWPQTCGLQSCKTVNFCRWSYTVCSVLTQQPYQWLQLGSEEGVAVRKDGRRMCAADKRRVICTCYLQIGKTMKANSLMLAVMHFNCSIKMGTFCKVSGADKKVNGVLEPFSWLCLRNVSFHSCSSGSQGRLAPRAQPQNIWTSRAQGLLLLLSALDPSSFSY